MRHAIEISKWAGLIVGLIACAYFLDWNENRSPWGMATQAAKLEILKQKICN